MALPINMDDLINQRVVESTRIEFKGDWNPNPIIHSICAFANDIDNVGGGLCVWGGINLLEGYGQDNPAANAHVR